MANNQSNSTLIKLVWQTTLVVALILGAWVLGRTLPIDKWFPALQKEVPPAPEIISAPAVSTKIDAYALPRISEQTPSALSAIAKEITQANKEVLVCTRSITSALIWSALRDKAQTGVTVRTLISPENTNNFAQGKLAQWLRDNNMTAVYKDSLSCASNMVIIDEQTVVISDLPFSQKDFELIGEGPEALKASTLGVAYVIHSDTLARDLARMVRLRLVSGNKLL
jgi:hypothetical protein